MQFQLSLKLMVLVAIMLSSLFQSGCSKSTSTPFILPDNLYTIKTVIDIGNHNNASDIKITVDPSNLLVPSDILNTRLLITKAAKTITGKAAGSLASGKYFSFAVNATKGQIIKPDASLKDSDGEIIRAGDYNAYIFTQGKENSTQLSAPKSFTLSDKPVLAGDFLGTWEDLGPPGPGSFTISLRINTDYSGSLFYSDNFRPYGKGGTLEDAKMMFTISGNRFTCTMNQFIGQYTGGGAFGTNGGCPNVKELSGTVVEDVNLVFDQFVWADCDGSREVKMKFTKQ